MIKTKLLAFAIGALSLSVEASAISVTVPVAKDAYVSSYLCCVQDTNFGTQEQVSVGQYNNYRTQAWFGFDFTDVHAFGSRTSAMLVIPAVTLGENAAEVKVNISLATQDWQEDALTFNNKPEVTSIAHVTIKNNQATRIDLSDALYEKFSAGEKDLTIVLETEGGGHFVLPSKESTVLSVKRPEILLHDIIHF